MFHPGQLFGASLGDGRAVRRYWARLARKFRDEEPEVFQHARQLFERARDVGEATDVPIPSEQPVSRPAPVESVDVVEAVVRPAPVGVAQWLAAKDHAALARLVEFDPGSITGKAPMRDVLLAVVLGAGPDLTEGQRAAVERELDHQLLELSPDDEARIRNGLADGEFVREMRLDDAVPPALMALVHACGVLSVPDFVEAMNDITATAGSDDYEALLTRLRDSPPAWAVIRRAVATLAQRSRHLPEPVQVPPALLDTFTKRTGLPEGLFMAFLLTALTVGSLVGLFVIRLVFGRFPGGDEDPLLYVVIMPGSLAVGASLVGGYLVDLMMKRQATTRQEQGVRDLSAAFNLFPSEVCGAIWEATDALAQGPLLQRALHTMELDPRLLFDLWSPELAARLLRAEDGH